MQTGKRILFWTAGLICTLIMSGCGAQKAAESTGSSADSTASAALSVVSEAETGSLPTESGTLSAGTEQDWVIPTQYGDLHFDDQWQDSVKTSETDQDGVADVAFTAEIDGSSYPLFDVKIGGDGDDAVGTLKDSEGNKRNVYIEPHDLDEGASLDDSEKNQYYAMKESVNYLIDHLG